MYLFWFLWAAFAFISYFCVKLFIIRVVRRRCLPGSNHHLTAAKVKVFHKWVKLQGQGHKVKNYGTMWKVLSQGIHMCNMKVLSFLVWKLWPRLKFVKSFSQVGQTSRSSSHGQILWYHVIGLVIRNTHVQYESPISPGKKVMAKVKVFKSRSNFKVKNYGTMWKALSWGIHIWKVKIFVHASNADVRADISSTDIRPGSLKLIKFSEAI